MHAMATSHVTFLYWNRRTLLGTIASNNGSVFFIDNGEDVFAVTAAHVIDGYLEEKSKSRGIACFLGGIPFDPAERLIAKGDSKTVDIATFRISRDEIAQLQKQAIDARVWPPPEPTPGQATFITGYPGARRFWVNWRELSFGVFSWSGPINSVSDRQVVCSFQREFWVPSDDDAPSPSLTRAGGLSGCPLLIPMERDGAWYLLLGGVVSYGVFDEVLYATKAKFLRSDGTISGAS